MSHAWMPLAIDDYLADTRHLTTLEHGAYLLLIMRYWQKGGLPDDERMIARIAGLNQQQWAECRDVLASFFDAGWRHGRIDAELEKAADIINKRRVAGSRKHVSGKAEANAGQVQSTCTDTRVSPLPRTNLSDADASGAAAPQAPAYTDARHELWGEGKPMLMSLGVPERQCGQLIGRWLKTSGDDCAGVLDAIQRAREARPHDPIPWITRALPTKANHDRASRQARPDPRPSGTQRALAGLAQAASERPDSRLFAMDSGGFATGPGAAGGGAADGRASGCPPLRLID